jgi:hypothetical protein
MRRYHQKPLTGVDLLNERRMIRYERLKEKSVPIELPRLLRANMTREEILHERQLIRYERLKDHGINIEPPKEPQMKSKERY